MSSSAQSRDLWLTLGLALLIGGLGGCSSDAASTGATQIGTAVAVAYKPCPGDDAAIEQLALCRTDETLDPLQQYSFEATATDGTEWGGPGFPTNSSRARSRSPAKSWPFETGWTARPPVPTSDCPILGCSWSLQSSPD